MPTFRNGQETACYHFNAAQLQTLHQWLSQNNAVLGVREHMADRSGSYTKQLQTLPMLSLPTIDYPNPEILYRIASILITDYSSCFIDFMLTNKPMISFAYDLDHYASVERGLFYDLEHVFPGPVCRTFGALQQALAASNEPSDQLATASYQWKKRIFFDHYDDGNSMRLVRQVKYLLD
jgi:CDP-glycerol glycerophosphotransferase (TagB/SpsB family)